MEHPRSVSVSDGELASFTCSDNTSEDVTLTWRVVFPKMEEIQDQSVTYYTEKQLKINLKRNRGIIIKYETSSSSEAVTIQIPTTIQMDGAVVQCAATGNSQSVASSYSMFAILQVQPLPESSGDGASGYN